MFLWSNQLNYRCTGFSSQYRENESLQESIVTKKIHKIRGQKNHDKPDDETNFTFVSFEKETQISTETSVPHHCQKNLSPVAVT